MSLKMCVYIAMGTSLVLQTVVQILVAKLYAQIKKKLIPNNINYFINSSAQLYIHIIRDFIQVKYKKG